MKRIKAAVIGTGFIGRQHMEAIARIPGVELTAVADQNEALVQKLAAEWGIRGYTDYMELLEGDVDAVHICTVNAMHYPVCKQAILKHKHVYCEKPLTLTLGEAKELTDLAGEYQVAAAADFNYRNNAMVREMKARMDSGQIGSPLLVNCSYLQDWMLYDTDYDWRLEPENAGLSRAVADIGSHCFDTIQFLLQKRIAAVYAKLITAYQTRKKVGGTFSDTINNGMEEVPVKNEDAALILFELEGGVMGSISVSQICAGKKNAFRIHISGSEAALEWNQEQADRLWVGRREGGNEELFCGASYLSQEAKGYTTLPAGHPAGWTDAFCNGLRCFYTSVKEGTYREQRQDYATFSEALGVMRLVEACMESSRENRWVKVSYGIRP